MINQPTPADIAAVLEEIGAGETFEPDETPYCWDCTLYEADRKKGEGQAESPGKAMAYAWIMAHWFDAIASCYEPDFEERAAELIPPEVIGEQWRFVVRPPSLEFATELTRGARAP